MFSYSEVTDRVQALMHNRDYVDYVNVVYNDENSILKDCKPLPVMVVNSLRQQEKNLKDFTIRNDDVWILGYPRTGTTLAVELVTTIMHGLDFEKVEQMLLWKRVAFLERFFVKRLQGCPVDEGYKLDSSNGRAMKSHLPMTLLPDGLLRPSEAKMVYIARNPKDAAVSWYHFFPNCSGFDLSFDDFLDCYLKGDIIYGSYFQHLSEYLGMEKVVKNLLIIKYEELVNDPIPVIKRVAEFLNKPISDEDATNVAHFIHFDKMKDRKNSNMEYSIIAMNRHVEDFDKNKLRFYRKGKTDTHLEDLTAEQIEKFDEEMEKWPGIMELYPNFPRTTLLP